MVLRAKYLNYSGSGCPVYRTLEPGKVLNAILYLQCTDSKGYIHPLCWLFLYAMP